MTKTTYDNTYTDAQIFDMSKQASSKAWTEMQRSGVIPAGNVTETIVNGVPFRVLINVDPKTKLVTGIYSHPGMK